MYICVCVYIYIPIYIIFFSYKLLLFTSPHFKSELDIIKHVLYNQLSLNNFGSDILHLVIPGEIFFEE